MPTSDPLDSRDAHDLDLTSDFDGAEPVRSFVPPGTRRAAPPNGTSDAASKPEVSHVLQSLHFLGAIRDSVLTEIVDRDRARLTDAVHARLQQRLQEQQLQTVKSSVAAEFADRMKIFGVLAGIASLVLGFVGYSSMKDSLTTTARAEAEEQASKKVGEAVAQEMLRIEALRVELTGMLERGEKRVGDSAAHALDTANKAALVLTGRVTDALNGFNQAVDNKTREEVGRAETAVANARNAAKLDLDSEGKNMTAALASAASEELKRITASANRFEKELEVRVSDEVRRQLRAQFPASGSVSSPEPVTKAPDTELGGLRREHLERIVERDATRSFEYATLSALAAAVDPESDAGTQRYLLDPVLSYPAHYSAAEREAAARLTLSARTPAQDRRGAAIEVLISALRAQDLELFEVGRRSLAENPYTRLLPSDEFTELIESAMTQPDSDVARHAFGAVDEGELTLKGRVNLLALGKRAGMGGRLALLQERVLVDLFQAPDGDTPAFLDRWSDYPQAAFVIDVLLAAPVVERERVVDALERIRKLIFRADSDPDPFKLRARIDEFLGE